jgi:predicted Ser/Thr protein kinase
VSATVDGRYQVLGELGRGGMGVVYRARDVPSGREVALKVVLGRLDPKALARFQREGELAARLDHPGIVRVHSAGEAEGKPYLAYELVEGRGFDAALAHMKRRARVEVVRDAAQALGYAHAHGVVHRDVKAENVLVDQNGRGRVADFGLATAQDMDRLTQTGTLLGTPSYMSPEQVDGRGLRPGPASDVWSLGVLLYLALTDELPFVADGMIQLVGQIMGGVYDAPRKLDPSVPPGLDEIVRRALQGDPEDRYPDGAAMGADLDAWLAGRYRVQRRRPALALAVGGALLLLGVGGAWAAASKAAADSGQVEEGVVAGGEREGGGGDPPAPVVSPARLAAARDAAAKLEGKPPKALVRSAQRWLKRYRDLPAEERAPVEALARTAQLEFPLASIVHDEAGGGTAGAKAYFLGNDRVLTHGRDLKTRCWKLSDPSRPEWQLPGTDPIVGGLGVHPSGEAFVVSVTRLDGDLRAYDAASREFRQVPGVEPGAELRNVVFSRDGGRFFVGAPYVGILVHRWPSLERERVIEFDLLRGLAVSPDGALVAAVGGPWKPTQPSFLRVWRVTDGSQVLERIYEDKVMRSAVDFHPAGDRLVVGTLSGGVYTLLVDDPDTTQVFRAEGGARDEVSFGTGGAHGGPVTGVRYGPKGALIFTAAKAVGPGLSSELRVWDARSGELLRERAGTTQSCFNLDMSIDGRRVAVGSEHGTVEVLLAHDRE